MVAVRARVAVGWIIALSGCSFEHGEVPRSDGSLPDEVVTGPWLAGYHRRKQIVITPPGATALADFPVGIVESGDPDLASHALGDGSDITFTAQDATTPLAAELATFDHATGELEAWVRIPSLQAPTTIWLYYDGSASTADPTAAWPALFAGVWHLEKASPGHDSTTHAHHLAAPTASAAPTGVAGIAGAACDYDGIDDSLDVASPSDGSLDFGMASFSYSLWVHVISSLGGYDTPIYKGCASPGDPGYCMLLGSAGWEGKLHDGTAFVDAELGPSVYGAWVYLAVVVDRTTMEAYGYADGAYVSHVDISGIGSMASTKSFEVGVDSGGSPFHGTIDETRVYGQALTADWIATEYANLTSESFLAIGSEQGGS